MDRDKLAQIWKRTEVMNRSTELERREWIKAIGGHRDRGPGVWRFGGGMAWENRWEMVVLYMGNASLIWDYKSL